MAPRRLRDNCTAAAAHGNATISADAFANTGIDAEAFCSGRNRSALRRARSVKICAATASDDDPLVRASILRSHDAARSAGGHDAGSADGVSDLTNSTVRTACEPAGDRNA
jgi:hypothetical protein